MILMYNYMCNILFLAGKHSAADFVCGIPVRASQYCSFCYNCKYNKNIYIEVYKWIFFSTLMMI